MIDPNSFFIGVLAGCGISILAAFFIGFFRKRNRNNFEGVKDDLLEAHKKLIDVNSLLKKLYAAFNEL